jgi:hypothetical protein
MDCETPRHDLMARMLQNIRFGERRLHALRDLPEQPGP